MSWKLFSNIKSWVPLHVMRFFFKYQKYEFGGLLHVEVYIY